MPASLPARIACWVLLLLALAGIVFTVLPSVSTNTWWIRTLDFPRLEFLIVMVVVWPLLAVVARGWTRLLALLLLAGAIAYDASVLYRFTPLVRTEQRGAATCPDGNRLRLLEANVQMTNTHDTRLIDMVRRVAPDVAWFQETDAWWEGQLDTLSDILPHHVGQARSNYFGVQLYAGLPLEDAQVNHLTGSANPSVFAGIRLPGGALVRLYAIHPRPPQRGQSTAERDAQLLATALAAHEETAPRVVLGDMNAVPWEDVIGLAKRVGGFLDPRIGRGLFITWNAESAVLKWPLDYILPSAGLTLLSLQVLPEFGSDHRPLLAEFCLDPAAASGQPAPALQPGDLEQAREAVRAGQQRADQTGSPASR